MTDDGKPVKQVLSERGARYGDFTHHAEKTEAILSILETSPSWKIMLPFQRQALRTIADKLARIANGDPFYDDNYRDIAGYATLVLERLEVEKKKPGFLERMGLKVPPAPPAVVEKVLPPPAPVPPSNN